MSPSATVDLTKDHRRRDRTHVHLHAFFPSHCEQLADPSTIYSLGRISGICMEFQVKSQWLSNGREKKLSKAR